MQPLNTVQRRGLHVGHRLCLCNCNKNDRLVTDLDGKECCSWCRIYYLNEVELCMK